MFRSVVQRNVKDVVFRPQTGFYVQLKVALGDFQRCLAIVCVIGLV